MDNALEAGFEDAERVALNYAPASVRPLLATFFALDRRLAQLLAQTTEPLLAQMKLAWWREMIGKPVSERPTGDVVLDAVSQHWEGGEAHLVRLIEAWEVFGTAENLNDEVLEAFGSGRSSALVSLFEFSGQIDADRASRDALRWALADAAAHVSDEKERERIVQFALDADRIGGRHPRNARSLAVLGALANRSLHLGGVPLLGSRVSALIAFRAGLFGK